ncbi:Glycosyl transferase, group 2 family protein [Flavobacterium psychrophilum]|nr:Glycosyl transferase, group 2 family protein [Flavobacterium psychrophilum]SNB43348.1 Glycosyl transferase, group 2 family protein [Flavobacterium psychrophilum]
MQLMNHSISDINSIKSLNYCVIVPTYNNHKTLTRVLDSVLEYTTNVIIINDGSTDSTAEILKKYSNITQIHHSKNAGKGIALQNGFRKALELNFDYAITIDSDGQHFASDIPSFIDEINANGEALLIGSRNMTQENVPKKSSFGNKFSNFWFWFETGIKLEDTQSGYRLYPLQKIPKNYFTNKFEFEIEVIVRTAWKGIAVKNIPIQVLYDPSERVSHFRPFRDFTRISILNTVLVAIAIFYIKPIRFFLSLKKKGIKKFVLENILHHDDSNLKKSLSITLGVFIGVAPFWGFQTIIVLFLAIFFKLNKLIAFAFSNVSFPIFIPFIIYGSLKTGSYFVRTGKPLLLDTSMTLADVESNVTQYLIGSFVLATIMSIIFGLFGYFLLTIFSASKSKK